MWLNAHCAIGRNSRRRVACIRQITAVNRGLSTSTGSDVNVVYHSRQTWCDETALAGSIRRHIMSYIIRDNVL